jgi:GNAT superfamily N-acetyltransferase
MRRMSDLVVRAFAMHSAAWQVRGRIRAGDGGDTGRVRGMELMVSGLRQPQWDAADVLASDADVEAARAWYAERGIDRFGARIPASLDWQRGRHLFRKPLMALAPADFRTAPLPDGIRIRTATPGDLDAVVAVDADAYEYDDLALGRAWAAPSLEHPHEVTAAIAVDVDGVPVGGGHVVHAGGAGVIAAVAVAERARRQGIGSAVSSWLVERALEQDAELVVLDPDDDRAAHVYARLGFEPAGAFDVYADL